MRKDFTIGELCEAAGVTEKTMRIMLRRIGADVDIKTRNRAELVSRDLVWRLSSAHLVDKVGRGVRKLLYIPEPSTRRANLVILAVVILALMMALILAAGWALGWFVG